jgi:hypothetical protein
MTIVHSSILEVWQQKDGRRYVKEVHINDYGEEEIRIYLGGTDDDLEELLLQHAQEINDRDNVVGD